MTIHSDVAATQRQGFTERVGVEELRLRDLLGRLYGGDPRLAETLDGLLADVREAWYSRPDELKELDEQRQRYPRWFDSARILAGVCYVDLYAGTFADLIERIPYFEELGLTVLHLMPVYDAPEPNSDGGYAVSSYRATKPALGSIEQLRDLATKLREAGCRGRRRHWPASRSTPRGRSGGSFWRSRSCCRPAESPCCTWATRSGRRTIRATSRIPLKPLTAGGRADLPTPGRGTPSGTISRALPAASMPGCGGSSR